MREEALEMIEGKTEIDPSVINGSFNVVIIQKQNLNDDGTLIYGGYKWVPVKVERVR